MKNVWWLKNNDNNRKKGFIIPPVLEMMWEFDESLLCQSSVYIKAMHLPRSSSQSGEKAHPIQKNQSEFNINTESTLQLQKFLAFRWSKYVRMTDKLKKKKTLSLHLYKETRAG